MKLFSRLSLRDVGGFPVIAVPNVATRGRFPLSYEPAAQPAVEQKNEAVQYRTHQFSGLGLIAPPCYRYFFPSILLLVNNRIEIEL